MGRKVKICAGRSHGCEETFLGCHDGDKGRCVVRGSPISSVRASKLMEGSGRKEIEPEGKTISLGKDPGVFGKDRGRKDQPKERKIISPEKALPPSISRALSREQVGIDPKGSADGGQEAHRSAKHKWNLKSCRTENSKQCETGNVQGNTSDFTKERVPASSTQVGLMSIPEQTSVQFPSQTGEFSPRSTAERHGCGQDVTCGTSRAPVGSSPRGSSKGLEPYPVTAAPHGTGRCGVGSQQRDEGSTAAASGGDHDQQGSSKEVSLGRSHAVAVGFGGECDRHHRTTEGQGHEPGICMFAGTPGGSCRVRPTLGTDVPRSGNGDDLLLGVGHHHHEGGSMLCPPEAAGRLGTLSSGPGYDVGMQVRKLSYQEGIEGPRPQGGREVRLQGTPASGQASGQLSEPSGVADGGSEELAEPEGTQGEERRGRDFFERLGQDEFSSIDGLMATKVDEEIWATTEAALGAECAREKLDEATCERLKQAAYRCEPDVFQSLVSHGRPVLFEIACSPESRLSACMQQMCQEPEKVRRFAFWNGYDISKSSGVRSIMSSIEKEKPLHVWLSLECGPFSPMQNVNQRTEKQREELKLKRAECMRQYVGGLLIYTFCHQLGITCTWEWSERCHAWRLPMVQRVFNRIKPRYVVVKGCRVGLKDQKTGLLLQKGWKLATTHELLGDRMNMPCQGNHEHGVCQGPLTRESAYYTEAFVKRACRAILDGTTHQGLWSELRSTEPLVAQSLGCTCEDVCHPSSNLQCSTCEMNRHREDPLSMVNQEEMVPFSSEERERETSETAVPTSSKHRTW